MQKKSIDCLILIKKNDMLYMDEWTVHVTHLSSMVLKAMPLRLSLASIAYDTPLTAPVLLLRLS